MVVKNNVKLVIDSDAHHPVNFAIFKVWYSTSQTRVGGQTDKSDIPNTLQVDI
jgi:hypothetical protein